MSHNYCEKEHNMTFLVASGYNKRGKNKKFNEKRYLGRVLLVTAVNRSWAQIHKHVVYKVVVFLCSILALK